MTIVVDTSALVAILQNEPEAADFVDILARNETVVSAGTAIEATRVAHVRAGRRLVAELHALFAKAGIEIVPVDTEQVALAELGMQRFGKGRGRQPAVLNFGDLFAYALAKRLDAPLLFKGDDFARTDVKRAT